MPDSFREARLFWHHWLMYVDAGVETIAATPIAFVSEAWRLAGRPSRRLRVDHRRSLQRVTQRSGHDAERILDDRHQRLQPLRGKRAIDRAVIDGHGHVQDGVDLHPALGGHDWLQSGRADRQDG